MPSSSSLRAGLTLVLAATIAGLAAAEPSAVLPSNEPRLLEWAQGAEDEASITLLSELATKSTLVVSGVVSATEASPTGPAGARGIHTAVELSGVEVLRGSAAGPVSFWVQGGVIGDRARRVVGQASFSVGQRVLVFLTRAPNGALWPTRMALGKWMVEPCEQGTCAVQQAQSVPIERALRAMEQGSPP